MPVQEPLHAVKACEPESYVRLQPMVVELAGAWARRAAGAKLLEAGNYASAAAYFREGLALQPRNALAYSYLGLAQASLQQYGGALVSFDAALQLEPDQALAKAARAQLLPLLR